MKNNTTEMVFILDRSGSMSGLEADTIGGFNSMIEKQKKEDGAAFVTTVLFDTQHAVLHDRLPLEKIPSMTDRDYCVGGGTALLDAVGAAIRQIETIHKYARPEDVPAHTVFIITTDGQENSSCNFSYAEVKKMIGAAQEKGWEFLFLGANIDAAEEAARIGIRRDRAANYKATARGTAAAFAAMCRSVGNVRREGCIQEDWQEELK
ncbi:MAG: VWA domain-containing protein [Oscillospiraceae bacterium]|nr:VWA domain-containing protein [Oscillospiraceae bacterium]